MNQGNLLLNGQQRLTERLMLLCQLLGCHFSVWHVHLEDLSSSQGLTGGRYLAKLQNQPCILFPVYCAEQADAESHFFPNLKCSSTAGTDMVHQPSPMEQTGLNTTVLGLWVSGELRQHFPGSKY